MKFKNNYKITSPSPPNNSKPVEISNHKNPYKNTISTVHSTSISNQVKQIKIPFSTYIGIDDFLQQPIFVHTSERSLNFKDHTGMSPDFETYQLNTSTYYHEQPYGRLVFSNVHALMNLNKETSKVSKGKTTSSKK